MADEPTTPADLARLIAHNGYLAYNATLIGNAPPSTRAIYERMSDPHPGDLVLETTTYHRDPWDPGALGYLTRTAEEPICTAEQWQEGGGEGPVPMERAYYIRTFVPTEDGRHEVRWHNASFIALPDRLRWVADRG